MKQATLYTSSTGPNQLLDFYFLTALGLRTRWRVVPVPIRRVNAKILPCFFPEVFDDVSQTVRPYHFNQPIQSRVMRLLCAGGIVVKCILQKTYCLTRINTGKRRIPHLVKNAYLLFRKCGSEP